MDKITDAVLSTRHPLYDWTQQEIEERIADFKEQLDNCPFKLVVAITMYNEEDFLEECLDNCLLINDLDAIHILDGAWVDGGKYGYSTDNSKNIIDNFKLENPELEVIYESSAELWRKQGDKRNHQLKRVHELWENSYIIVKDGDEVFGFPNGLTSIWLKPKLNNYYPALITMDSFAYNSPIKMMGARIIPSGLYHYNTEKSMIIHDKDHNTICNYNVDEQFEDETKCIYFNQMIYINHWNIRNRDRLKTKIAYAEKHVFNSNEEPECLHE